MIKVSDHLPPNNELVIAVNGQGDTKFLYRLDDEWYDGNFGFLYGVLGDVSGWRPLVTEWRPVKEAA